MRPLSSPRSTRLPMRASRRAFAISPAIAPCPSLVAAVMGTTVSIDVRDGDVTASALDAAVAVLRELEARFTTYRDDSEIKRIERGELSMADAHPDVREVLDACAVL